MLSLAFHIDALEVDGDPDGLRKLGKQELLLFKLFDEVKKIDLRLLLRIGLQVIGYLIYFYRLDLSKELFLVKVALTPLLNLFLAVSLRNPSLLSLLGLLLLLSLGDHLDCSVVCICYLCVIVVKNYYPLVDLVESVALIFFTL